MSGATYLSPDQVFHVEREVFEREARASFGPEADIRPQAPDRAPVEVTVQIERRDESFFQIFYSPEVIWTDGTADQAAEVALWVRGLLPDDPGGRIWMTDEGFSGHVELVPDMTIEDLRSGWVDHEEEPPELGEISDSGS